MVLFFLTIIVTYIVGSIPTSYILGKILRGVDLRTRGSGNLGATNAFRVLGWKIGLAVLVGDMLKGALPVLFLPSFLEGRGFSALSVPTLALVIGLVAILGHVFTIFMRFRGGKGVATTMGVFAALAPLPFIIALSVSLALIAITRYVSVGSIIGAVLLPALIALMRPERKALFVIALIAGFVIIVKHRANIRRLIRGEENKIFP